MLKHLAARGTVMLASLALLGACASDVVRHPVELSATPATPPASFVVPTGVRIEFDSGYGRSIPAGTELAEVGSISQGRVLRPTNTIFAVEGAHRHEAYLVVQDARIVGFYLPVEKSFAPLSNPVSLPIQQRGSSK